MTCVLLIPARGGSQRIPRKNMRLLDGHPLLWYTIMAASESALTGAEGVVVVSEDDEILTYAAAQPGVHTFRRSPASATHRAPDILWMTEWLRARSAANTTSLPDALVTLRPTSPFRSAATIRLAWELFQDLPGLVDSMRSVRLAAEHPGKMWWIEPGTGPGGIPPLLRPVLDRVNGQQRQPWHSLPTQTLPFAYVQTAGLEIVRRCSVERTRTISGHVIAPFVCEDVEGMDLNTEDDWRRAETLLALQGKLP